MFSHIIFKIEHEQIHYSGIFNMNIVNYGIYSYIQHMNKLTEEESEINSIHNYIEFILNRCFEHINQPFHSYQLEILSGWISDIHSLEKLDMDFYINESNYIIKILNNILDKETYSNIIFEFDNHRFKYIDSDFIETDLEYTYNYKKINDMVWEKYESLYYPDGYDSDLEVDDSEFNEIVEQEKLEIELKEKSTDKNRLEVNRLDAENKINIYKYLISKYSKQLESIFIRHIEQKILTQYCRIFKNSDNHILNIQYNWKVISFSKEKYDNGGGKITIHFECDLNEIDEFGNPKKKYFEGFIRQIYNHQWDDLETSYGVNIEIESLYESSKQTFVNLIKYLHEQYF